MFTKDSRILNHRLTVPLTSVCKVVGDVFKPNLSLFDRVIKSLFANGDQGFAYDPNDLSTMYQDAAGVIPVTAVEQPVGLIRDKSGRNNHAFQTNSSSRPILRKNAVTGDNYLEFDGSDDFLRTNNIDFTATDKVSLFAGVRKLRDTGSASVVELSTNSGVTNGTFALWSPLAALANFSAFSRGTSSSNATTLSIFKSPISAVLTQKADISDDLNLFTVNGTPFQIKADQGTGNYDNHPLYIGRRGGTSLPFNGHLYSLIGVGKLVSDDEKIAIEKELAKRTGVTLNV